MKMQKAAAAVIVASFVAAALPALNWAQEIVVETPDNPLSRDMEKAMRDQEIAIRNNVEQIEKQVELGAQRAMVKATKSGDRFQILFDGRQDSAPIEMRIREAAGAVRDAKDDESRETATEELNSALDEYFEQDMQARGKELEDIRARLTKLQAQLDRRREKKAEIIDLQIKVALNEADGLGFYTEPKDQLFNFRVPPPPMVMPLSIEVPVAGGMAAPVPTGPRPTAPPAPAAPAPAPTPAPR